MEETLSRFGRIDALVNNAGIMPHNLPPLEAMPLEVWNQFININLTGAFLLSEKALFVTGQNFIVDGGMTVKMIYQ